MQWGRLSLENLHPDRHRLTDVQTRQTALKENGYLMFPNGPPIKIHGYVLQRAITTDGSEPRQ